MTAVNATTKKYAVKRGLDVTMEDINDDGKILLCVWEADNDCEWMFSYLVNPNGSYTWNGNIYLDSSVKEELPATIRDEKHLREVLAFIAANI
ncbi:hypothetical protein sortsyn_35 [Escherichia phage sortsyn]|uniref:Uncharacterized protein n=3 Tax=Murrayvirus TaxID=2733197 RepID=A0A3G8F5K3_9CAUD|nr:hypothetical protein HOU68_gp10 [Salmonella phage Lumpael]AZF88757.1 hypothetical protein [Salmonella phage Lumpael]QHR72900.1 hypothetical protein sortsyn_35 [Escherichia phage sortsyn]